MYFALGHIRQRNPVQHVAHAPFDFGFAGAVAFQSVGDVFIDIHHREQSQMLKDHFDVAFVGGLVDDRFALDPDVAGGRVFKAGNHPHQGRLATAGGPENGEKRAAWNRERDIIDSTNGTKILGNVDAFEIIGRRSGHSVPLQCPGVSDAAKPVEQCSVHCCYRSAAC